MNRTTFWLSMIVVCVILINIITYLIAWLFDLSFSEVETNVVYAFLGIVIVEWSWAKYER